MSSTGRVGAQVADCAHVMAGKAMRRNSNRVRMIEAACVNVDERDDTGSGCRQGGSSIFPLAHEYPLVNDERLFAYRVRAAACSKPTCVKTGAAAGLDRKRRHASPSVGCFEAEKMPASV